MASKDDLEANAEFIRLANAFVEVGAGAKSRPSLAKTILSSPRGTLTIQRFFGKQH